MYLPVQYQLNVMFHLLINIKAEVNDIEVMNSQMPEYQKQVPQTPTENHEHMVQRQQK